MSVLIISPPFVQLNSPYASLPFLQGFLKANGVRSSCLDLGIRITGRLFSKTGLDLLSCDDTDDRYCNTVGPVVEFLKGNNEAVAEHVLSGNFLPEGKMTKAAVTKELSGLNDHDYARYLSSLYLEDIFLNYQKICPEYGLSRYGERISLNSPVFDGIYRSVSGKNDLIGTMIEEELEKAGVADFDIIAFTIPFPGTLIGALKAAGYVKRHYPEKTIVFGGGYINTELRNITDPAIFDFTDFICLDDGEIPLLRITEFSENRISKSELVRTFYRNGNEVVFSDNSKLKTEVKRGTPDYSGLDMKSYIPVYESVNPMMKLWSEKDTLKLRLAKGCYWHKCAFCDTTLPYIKDYAPDKIEDIVSDIEKMANQTGINRFHFVDEALPPALLVKLSIELLRRNVKITWWGNVRFDKAFTEDVCRLLKEAGCIAAVGGLESASDRTLKRMNKGVTVTEAVKVMRNLSSAGILVHAYMIYGFPGETDRDLIESAEVLRQMFSAGIVHSAYWHRFALTVHSPVFADPEKYGLSVRKEKNPFANNGVAYTDGSGNDPDKFADGLKKSVYNWMLGICLDNEISTWFAFHIPGIKTGKNFVREILNSPSPLPDMNKKLVWLGDKAEMRGKNIVITGINGETEYELPGKLSKWLKDIIDQSSVRSDKEMKLSDAGKNFPKASGISFTQFLCNEIWDDLFDAGLLII